MDVLFDEYVKIADAGSRWLPAATQAEEALRREVFAATLVRFDEDALRAKVRALVRLQKWLWTRTADSLQWWQVTPILLAGHVCQRYPRHQGIQTPLHSTHQERQRGRRWCRPSQDRRRCTELRAEAPRPDRHPHRAPLHRGRQAPHGRHPSGNAKLAKENPSRVVLVLLATGRGAIQRDKGHSLPTPDGFYPVLGKDRECT